MDDVWNDRRGAVSVARTTNWKQTRIVAVTFLEQHVECPLTTRTNREIRCAESRHARATHVLEHCPRRPNVLSKLFGRERVDATVPISVRCNLVTGLRD